jgi:hypothetical protein
MYMYGYFFATSSLGLLKIKSPRGLPQGPATNHTKLFAEYPAGTKIIITLPEVKNQLFEIVII